MSKTKQAAQKQQVIVALHKRLEELGWKTGNNKWVPLAAHRGMPISFVFFGFLEVPIEDNDFYRAIGEARSNATHLMLQQKQQGLRPKAVLVVADAPASTPDNGDGWIFDKSTLRVLEADEISVLIYSRAGGSITFKNLEQVLAHQKLVEHVPNDGCVSL